MMLSSKIIKGDADTIYASVKTNLQFATTLLLVYLMFVLQKKLR